MPATESQGILAELSDDPSPKVIEPLFNFADIFTL
jgi:hypothetical protein